jgi:PAS domain S-box-containing protein
LPDSQELLRAILESASQAILTIDRSGRILAANQKTGEMFGYSNEELAGQPVEILLPESVRDKHTGHRTNYFAAPRVRPMGVGMDLSARRKDGQEFPVEISLSFIMSGGEHLAIAFVSDITQRKSLQERLIHAQKMEAIGRLAGGIAHDFNNLLTVISGFDRFLLKNLSPIDPLRGYAEEISKAAERATALTRQLLTFSRRQIIQPKVVVVNDIVVSADKMLRRLIGEHIDLALTLSPNTGHILADPNQVEQVLFNLVVNARDAMPHGGRIGIETANASLDAEYARMHPGVRPGLFVMIAVSDTGVGMDTETRRHIFEPFFTTKPADRGTGLGLATVYGIVKQNGGDIWLYSEPGNGTTFKVYWPRVERASEEQPSAQAAMKHEGGTETVLVVEDEPGVRQLICEVLRQEGYTVLESSDSLQAAQVSETYPGEIHLLVTDIVMPHSSGRDLSARLASSRPGMKVLYISGYTEDTIVHHGVLESDLAFLPKPFAFEALLGKMREILDSP